MIVPNRSLFSIILPASCAAIIILIIALLHSSTNIYPSNNSTSDVPQLGSISLSAFDRPIRLSHGSAPSGESQISAHANGTKQNGLSFIEYSIEGYSPQKIEPVLTGAQAVGANWITLVVNRYQYDVDSTLIYPTIKTAQDDDLRAAIQRAHALGLKVTLKPHLDVESGVWRGNIGAGFDETAWAAWFINYSSFLNHYADLASAEDVEQLVIGTELRNTSSRDADWRALISETRQRYDGLLTYSANHSGEELNITWWDALDSIGISAYYPLTLAPGDRPTLRALEAAWEPHLTTLEALTAQWNKPILFTEIGYRSTNDSHEEPWCDTCGSGVNQQIQLNAYEAFYNVVYQQDWLAGMHWWGWRVDPTQSGPCDGEYSPYNKGAENILRTNHGVDTRVIDSDCNGSPSVTPLPTTPTPTPLPPPTTEDAGFVLVDNFNALNDGLLDGQNGWQALGNVSLVNIPLINAAVNGGNLVLKAKGENALAHRNLPFGLTESTNNASQSDVGTLHFRLMRDGAIDGSSGASDEEEPRDFPGFEAQFAVQSGAEETFRARDGADFVSLNGTFAASQWYCVWMVPDVEAERYEIYLSGGQFSEPTQLNAEAGNSFAFRNGSVGSLRTFYVRMGWDLGHSLYLDDIYIDAISKNLASPISSCGAVTEPPVETPSPSPTSTPSPSPTPVQSSTENPTTNPTTVTTPTAGQGTPTSITPTPRPDTSPTVGTPQGTPQASSTPNATASPDPTAAYEVYFPLVE